MLYFAYGSNLQWEQMRERCPSARFVCVAMAIEYRLAFTHYSKRRQCGVADLVQARGDVVWGAVFEIDEVDVGRLDKDEGFRPGRPRVENAYERVEMHVAADGDKERPLAVVTYLVVKRLDPPPKPSVEYKQLILDGARHWHLPMAYVEQLEKIDTQ